MASNNAEYIIGDKVCFELILSGMIYKCSGTITEIHKEVFKLKEVKIDNEFWSKDLILQARYEDIKNGILTKI